MKLLIAQRQLALAKWGKTSDNYKQLRNRVQEACSKCKTPFYENKVSGLQDSNISRWWKDIKDLGGLSCPGDWSSQLIGREIPDEATLALISLDGGRTLKIWVAFRAPVIGHLS